MRFGLSFLPDAGPATMSAAEYFANALELCRVADDAGMDSAKMTEHLLHPYGGYCPSPLAFFAAVAASTRRLRLVTGGVLPSLHHPLQLAAEAAMIDAISGGRLEVGFARGYMPYEFAALGVPMDGSRDRFVATVETVLRLWTEEHVSVETPFFTFHDATSLPRPTQQPHPPVWIAASTAPETFAWIGAKRFKLMATFVLTDRECLRELIATYRESFASATSNGGAPVDAAARPEVALSIPLYVAESDAAARAEGGRFLRRYFAVWANAARAWNGVHTDAYTGYSHLAEVISASTPERLQKRGSVVFGSPIRVIDHIAWLYEEFGVDHIMWQVDFGAMPRETALRSLRTFTEHVLPMISETSAST